MIQTGRQVNVLLGQGDETKFNLLGGSFGNAGDVVLFGSGAQAHIRKGAKDQRLGGGVSEVFFPGAPKPPGCVHVDSWLPGGLRAGDVRIGDRLLLIDGSEGVVTYSETKARPLFRIVTAGLVSLVCSADAPIPVRAGGYRTPAALLGQELRPRVDGVILDWDVIVDVQALCVGDVQHITVGDECFWAGEHPGACLPHHNDKDPGPSPDPDRSGRRGDR